MSIVTREMLASAASSPHGLTVGTLADPIRLSWREVHDQAKRMAGSLAAKGVGRHGSVAVLAADAADVAPLAQAVWMRRAALTMLQQPTPRADLAVWLGNTVLAIRMIRADVVVVGEPFLMALDHLAAHDVAVCTVESMRGARPISRRTPMRRISLCGSSPRGPPPYRRRWRSATESRREHRGDERGVDIDIDRDVVVSWLPLSHDMGMIGFYLFPHATGSGSRRGHVRSVPAAADCVGRVDQQAPGDYHSGPNFAYSVLARVLDLTTRTPLTSRRCG